jgi:putative oxidoreductase
MLISSRSRSDVSWLILRCVVAGLIAAHGWARWVAGGVEPFGRFLETQGFPFGFALAIAITGVEIVGSILLICNRFVTPLCALFASIYTVGIALVHAKAGWFVVGLGRNGAEFSVLLIFCLVLVGVNHWPGRRTNAR